MVAAVCLCPRAPSPEVSDVYPELTVLGFIQWLGDRILGAVGRCRAFDATTLDATVRLYDATTAGFVAMLEHRRPADPRKVAGDTTYVDAASIGDDEAVVRLAMMFTKLEGMGGAASSTR